MQKLLLVSGNLQGDDTKFNLPWTRCLGHELHIMRIMLIDMLLKESINQDDIIVTQEDRKFLYTKIFKNVISYEEYKKLDKKDYYFIPIVCYSGHLLHSTQNLNEFNEINYTIPKKFYTEELKNLCTKIDYLNLDYDFINNNFIIIHHRFNQDINKLKKILEIVKKMSTKIIIFNNNIVELKNNLNDNSIFYVNNLQVYASLLNNENCKLLISEWSGGGQLSQYTSNCKVIFYYDAYFTLSYKSNLCEKQREKDSMESEYIGIDFYDFKSFTNSERLYYKDFNNFIENLESIII